jgi:hypothetical protein
MAGPTFGASLLQAGSRRQLRIRENHRRHQIRKIAATKTPFAKIPPPGKQQGRRNPMPARRRRNLPMTLMALFDDTKLLFKAPTTSPPGINHFQTTNLRTIRMPSHKDTQHQITQESKAAYAG